MEHGKFRKTRKSADYSHTPPVGLGIVGESATES